MMYILAILTLAATAVVAPPPDHNNDLDQLINMEVDLIIKANPNQTEDECSGQCDSMFHMAQHHDEDETDHKCREACRHALGPADPHHPDPHHGPAKRGPDHGPHGPEEHSPLHDLIRHEVEELVHMDHSIDQAECEIKCDGLFDLMGDGDENVTDAYCAQECMNAIHTRPDGPAGHGPVKRAAAQDQHTLNAAMITLITDFITALYAEDAQLSSHDCKTKCDREFAFVVTHDHDEGFSDRICHNVCTHPRLHN